MISVPLLEPSPTSRRLGSLALLMSIAASLAACGGGGSDSSAGNDPVTPPVVTAGVCKDSDIAVSTATPAPAPALPPAPVGAVVISGKAVFESVPTSSAGLNYAASSDKPIRGATVQVLDGGGAVLTTSFTDDQGNYSVGIAAAQAVRVRIRAEVKRTGSPSGDRDFSILDNTAGNAIYVLDSASFTPLAITTKDLRAASGWNGTSYATPRAAAPFSILDVVYSAQAKIATVATVNLPPLKVYWSVNNKPASPFNAATGDIITSFFTTTAAGRALYVLGAANTDTDEYDTHIVAHEFGHYLQSALSRDDSVGGRHGARDKLDARVAFSEGWGNAWSGIALGSPIYTDTFGANQASSFSIDVSVAATGTDRGWYSETAAQYLVWTSSQSLGFSSVYRALAGLSTSPAFTSLYSFASGLKNAAVASASSVTSLWATQNIVSQDPCGTGETNNGGITGAATTLPVYKTHTAALGAAQNYCVTAAADPNNEQNKLGEFVYVRFTVTAGSHTLTVVKTSPAGAATTDPDFTLLKSDGTKVLAESGVDDMETLTVTLPTGTHSMALSDFKLVSANTSCFNFTVN